MPIHCFALTTKHEKNIEMSTSCREAVQGSVDISYFFRTMSKAKQGKTPRTVLYQKDK